MMNILHKTAFLLIFGLTALTSSAALTPYVEATEQAEKDKQYMVVVWNGSDWSPEAREFTKNFEEITRQEKLPVIWCEWDERNNITPEEKADQYFKKMAPPTDIWNIPAVVIVSPDKQVIYKLEGMTVPKLKALLPRIPAIIANQEKADRYWQQADTAKENAKDAAAVRLYDKGLSLLPRNVVKGRKDILDKIKKIDPDDKNGVLFKTDFAHTRYLGHIDELARKQKDLPAAKKFIAEKLAIKGLSKDQQQKLIAGRFMIARQQKDTKEALKQLDIIRRINPKSEMGRGAVYYAKFLSQPITLKGNKFTDIDMRHEFTPAFMDASPYIKSPGRYRITVHHFSGDNQSEFRNPKLMSGNRTIVNTPAEIKDKKGTEFLLDVPSVPSNLKLVIEIKGRGWFHSVGEILITKEQ